MLIIVAYISSSSLVSYGMEAETKLHNCESGRKFVTIITNPGPERSFSFDRDEPRMRTASTVSRGAEEIERRYKKWLRAEIVGLAVLIIIVWGLLLLPIIFYHLPNVQSSDRVSIHDHASIIAWMHASHLVHMVEAPWLNQL